MRLGVPYDLVGASDLSCVDDEIRTASGGRIREGDVITIDGTTGQVWRGAVAAPAGETVARVIEEELPQLLQLEEWAQQYPGE